MYIAFITDFPECDKLTEFMCTEDKRCLPDSLRCDGKADCNDKTDEKYCGMYTTKKLYSSSDAFVLETAVSYFFN